MSVNLAFNMACSLHFRLNGLTITSFSPYVSPMHPLLALKHEGDVQVLTSTELNRPLNFHSSKKLLSIKKPTSHIIRHLYSTAPSSKKTKRDNRTPAVSPTPVCS